MSYGFNVLVAGRPIETYNHRGDVYVEGRQGSDYELELVNNSSVDASFVVSVDGLSILDGKPASKDSEGYLVRAFQRMRVPGWKVNGQTAAAFKFGSRSGSYAQQSGNDAGNCGVIGCQVFQRKTYMPPFDTLWGSAIPLGGLRPTYSGGQTTGEGPRFGGSRTKSAPNALRSATKSFNASPGVNVRETDLSHNLNNIQCSSFTSSLGTEFGAAKDFRTTKVEFERADAPAATFTLYYGSSRDLNKLGIQMVWQRVEPKRPNAFPADGCTPPDGWQPYQRRKGY